MKTSNSQKSLYALPFLFLLALTIVSCSSSTSTPPNNNNNNSGVTKPKMGSTFTDSSYTKDTTLKNNQASGTVVTYTLIDTNGSKSTQSGGVYVFVSAVDTIWQHYEANGDLSVYAPFAAGPYVVGSEWVTFPVSSQAASDITTFKAVLLDTITISGHMTGAGSGAEQVGSQSLAVGKATMNVTATSLSAGTVPGVVNVSFAPSIGFVTHQIVTTTGAALGFNLTGGSDKRLISYTLK